MKENNKDLLEVINKEISDYMGFKTELSRDSILKLMDIRDELQRLKDK
jgi:hypothetical protein